MKSRLHSLLLNIILILIPLFCFSQIQIGSDILGEDGGYDELGNSISFSSDGNKIAIGAPSADVNGIPTGKVRIYENIGGVWTKVGDDIDGESQYDDFGKSVSLSSDGNIVAVGARYNADNGFASGNVRIFENIGGVWTQVGEDIYGESVNDYSGESVSLSSDGSIVAIGAIGNDDNGNTSGHIRVYENIGGVWTQTGQDIDGEAAGDRLGQSVSLSSDGSIVAIGAPDNDGNGNSSGHVRIYENVGSVWTQIGNDIDGEMENDRSGLSISFSSDGSIVAIGAPNNDGNGSNSGHVRVYNNIGGVWTQIGQDIDGEATGDNFGTSVSLSSDGSIVAIGAIGNDGNGSSSGHVRVYENVGGVWTQIGSDIDGDAAADWFGASVSLSSDGGIVAIGAPRNDGNGSYSGQVRIYENLGGVWTQIGSDIEGEDGGYEYFGRSLSFSSNANIVAIGAPFADVNNVFTGKVRIFENIGGVWIQIGQDIDGEAQDDYSGESVSISSDGSIVAIGAPQNDGNGLSSGHVRVYENIGGLWTQIGQDIDGEAEGDNFGHRVSLSSNGNIVAVGAINNDGNGSQSGHVRVYENLGGVWTQIGQDINGVASYDQFGRSVSLSSDGSIVAIGTPYNSIGNGIFYNGIVRIYENIGGIWTQLGGDMLGGASQDYLGESVSLSSDGNIVAVGATGRTPGFLSDITGYVRVFENIGGVWTQIGQDINGEAIGDNFGTSVSLSSNGSIVAIGAKSNDGNGNDSGHVRIYQNIGNTWSQIGSDIDGDAAGDWFGESVSLSSDGSVVGIGSPYHHGNGGFSGQVKIFDLNDILSNTEIVYQNKIKLYPNPTKDILTISTTDLITMVNVSDINGRFVLNQSGSNNSSLELDLSSLSKGMYFVNVQTDSGIETIKVVKQ